MIKILETSETDNPDLKVKSQKKKVNDELFEELSNIGKKSTGYILDDSIFSNFLYIEGPEKRGCDTYFFLFPDGIYSVTKKINYKQKHNIYEKSLIYEWDNFEIKGILINDENNEIHIDFILNNRFYKDYLLQDMKKILFDLCFCDGPRSCINRLITKLIDTSNDNYRKFSKYCGFGEDGWKLPPEYYISSNSGISSNIHKTIEKMNTISYNSDMVKQQFKRLFELTSIKYRDIIFSFCFANIFAYSLKKEIGLQPFLGIGSKGGGRGKTIVSTLLTTKLFMNLDDKDVLTIDNVESKSRFLDYISASTFTICIDDCEKLDDSVKSEIKSHLTSIVTTDRKDSKQRLISSEILKSSLILNYNEIPEFLIDLQILSRGILIDVSESVYDPTKAIEWRKLFNEIPSGAVGKYIIDSTRAWKKEDLLKLFYNQDNLKPDSPAQKIIDRQNIIFKFISMGKEIFKLLFDIDLNLKELPEVIFKTISVVSESYIEDFIKQLTAEFEESFGSLVCKESNWIKHKVNISKTKQQEYYYCYTSENMDDLNKHRFGSDKSRYFTLSKFQQLINTILPCTYTTQRTTWREEQISVKMIQVMKQSLLVYLSGGIDAIIKEKEKYLLKIQN